MEGGKREKESCYKVRKSGAREGSVSKGSKSKVVRTACVYPSFNAPSTDSALPYLTRQRVTQFLPPSLG